MKKVLILIIFFSFLWGIEYTKKEKEFLKNNPIIYISAMTYWPVDKEGESIHTNYMRLLNKYGNLNLQPVFYKYWSDGFNDAKEGITYGIMALSYSKQRTKWFYYTRVYNYNPYYLIVSKNSDIHSIKDLKNKKVFIAKNSILREKLKHNDFNIVYTKHAYKKLVDGDIDAVLVFYIPKTKYLNQFRIIKTFIDKAGEEHIGINKKYPELYSIITKVMEKIPYSEIEKIRKLPYETRIEAKKVLESKVSFKDLISLQDILMIFVILLFLGLILYYLLMRKFLHLKIKQFLLTIFIFNIAILIFILYEILTFNYYSNKILEIKSKSFNALYLTDEIEYSIINLDEYFKRAYYYKTKNNISKLFVNNYINADNLIVNNVALKNLLTTKNFTTMELSSLAYIQKLIKELLEIQKKVLNHKLNISIYHQKLLYLIYEFKNLKDMIKAENQNEISIIKTKLKYQFLLLLFSVGFFIIEAFLVFIMIKRKIYNPITYLINVIKDNKRGVKIEYKEFRYKDEFGKLIDEFFELQRQLHNKISELNLHKKNLEKEIKEEVEKRVYQENILIKKSKMAIMGEMMDAVAHQWKQPLNSISLGIQILKLEKDKISSTEFNDMITSIEMQVKHMFATIDQFRGFFKHTLDENKICMNEIISKVLFLLKDDLMLNSIKVETNIDSDFCIKGIENEFQHLLITLITNAKDIFKERDIKDRKIIINTKEDNEFYYLEVIDNGGGVDESIKDKIFELNYTTRKDGTGVGLYLASQIAIKHNGTLDVENTENGAKFYFKIKKENK